MENLTKLIEQVSDKALGFKQKVAELEAALQAVQSELDESRNQLSQSKAENELLKADLERQMNDQPENSTIASSDELLNERIDELVKEIDACLAHLK
jgi:multidrug resistance efflux pump